MIKNKDDFIVSKILKLLSSSLFEPITIGIIFKKSRKNFLYAEYSILKSYFLKKESKYKQWNFRGNQYV